MFNNSITDTDNAQLGELFSSVISEIKNAASGGKEAVEIYKNITGGQSDEMIDNLYATVTGMLVGACPVMIQAQKLAENGDTDGALDMARNLSNNVRNVAMELARNMRELRRAYFRPTVKPVATFIRVIPMFNLQFFAATSAQACREHRQEADDGGEDDGESDPARTRYLQRARVLSILLEGVGITQKEATTLDVHRLASRICELKKRGWNIQKTTLPGRFARYHLDPNNPRTDAGQGTLFGEDGTPHA